MSAIRLVVAAWTALVLCAAAHAQEFEQGLATAARRVGAAEWAPALDVLLGLEPRARSADELSRLAERLDQVCEALQEEAEFEAQLRGLQAGLAIQRRLGDRPEHSGVIVMLGQVGSCLRRLGRERDALLSFDEALAMARRVHGDADHVDVVYSLSNRASCLRSLGRADEALPQFQAALAMHRRMTGGADDADAATITNNIAYCLETMGRADEALQQFAAALALRQRLLGGSDHPLIAQSLGNYASCLETLGRAGEAVPRYEEVLAMLVRLHGETDEPAVADVLNNLAYCLESLGRFGEALPKYQAALAMWQRLCGDADHAAVARAQSNVAACLGSMGRPGEALPLCEASLAMRQRLLGGQDHPELALGLNNLAQVLGSLGRVDLALPRLEAVLAMERRLHRDADHPAIAVQLDTVGLALVFLDRPREALPFLQDAAAMLRRIHRDADHPDLATEENSIGLCLRAMRRPAEALPHVEAALAMHRRLLGEIDHPDVAASLYNLADCFEALGQASAALPNYEASLAMIQRLHGAADHRHVAVTLNGMASCLSALGQTEQALVRCRLACEMLERLRESNRTSAALRQSLFDDLKRGRAFERLQTLAVALQRPDEALQAAERSRGRELLDVLDQQRFDAFAEAERRAEQRGAAAVAARIRVLRTELDASELENSRLLHLLTRLGSEQLAEGELATRRRELLAQSDAAAVRRRQLLDERARLLGDVLPVGHVRTPAEIRTALHDGELFLEFTVDEAASLLYVVARDREAEAIPLPGALDALQRQLPLLLRSTSREQLRDARGRSPGAEPAAATDASQPARLLFASLIPKDLWPRLQSARRVFLAAHRALHRLPFELLVTGTKDGQPLHWLDDGPEIAYVQSGSALCWLRRRALEARGDQPALELLAVGDPRDFEAEPEVPERGVLVTSVDETGAGARAGLRPGDVLLSYDGTPLADDRDLGPARRRVEAAIEEGKRADVPIAIEVWRRGATLQVPAQQGVLGITVGRGGARAALAASLTATARAERATRAGELERLGNLPPLRGARAETAAIEQVFHARGGATRRLIDRDATEPAVFELAPRARFVHFACHGIAEEHAGQSLSTLVLSRPTSVLPGDDGLLMLDDLMQRWRARLSACQLVVLSACHTNVGTTLRDETPQALPLGFLFAGASSVISSLWAVDDDSTSELMADFYRRLAAGETDRLHAFTAAKRELRRKHPDPYHWAPFLYIGSPE